jgi:hypothetical protein
MGDADLLDDLRLLLRDGRQVQGADVYRPRDAPHLVGVAGLRARLRARTPALFDGAYRAFATHRHRFSRACGSLPAPPATKKLSGHRRWLTSYAKGGTCRLTGHCGRSYCTFMSG